MAEGGTQGNVKNTVAAEAEMADRRQRHMFLEVRGYLLTTFSIRLARRKPNLVLGGLCTFIGRTKRKRCEDNQIDAYQWNSVTGEADDTRERKIDGRLPSTITRLAAIQ